MNTRLTLKPGIKGIKKGDSMELTDDERKLLKLLVKKELEEFRQEGKTVINYDNAAFPALEERYEEFLEKLLKRL